MYKRSKAIDVLICCGPPRLTTVEYLICYPLDCRYCSAYYDAAIQEPGPIFIYGKTRSSANAEGLREVGLLVSRNPATAKHLT